MLATTHFPCWRAWGFDKNEPKVQYLCIRQSDHPSLRPLSPSPPPILDPCFLLLFRTQLNVHLLNEGRGGCRGDRHSLFSHLLLTVKERKKCSDTPASECHARLVSPPIPSPLPLLCVFGAANMQSQVIHRLRCQLNIYITPQTDVPAVKDERGQGSERKRERAFFSDVVYFLHMYKYTCLSIVIAYMLALTGSHSACFRLAASPSLSQPYTVSSTCRGQVKCKAT